jgi:CheY-like chemotaxis protein
MIVQTALLAGANILVLEDEYYLATDLQQALEAAGAVVIGPFGDGLQATQAVSQQRPDCAFVDVNFGDGPTFDLPRRLVGDDVPFAFVTGYDAGTIPDEFSGVACLEKPVAAANLVETALRLLGADGRPRVDL